MLPAEVRGAAAKSWVISAQFEHASIASFSRFSLELLAVGAPPTLIEGTHRAALDEVRHARLSFGLASAYGGAPIGPGTLALDARTFGSFDLVSSARSAALEGCFAETFAALEAQAAGERAEHALVKDVLAIVAREEADHASLATSFVAWALKTGGQPVRSAVRQTLEAALAQAYRESAPQSAEPLLEPHGRLSPQSRFSVRQQALREVIEPLVHALVT